MMGSCMNSIGKASGSVTSSKDSTVEVMAADVLVAAVAELPLDLSGHSAFQCPFFSTQST